ncbi:ATP-binding protein [Mesorhizobium sp.]|uniref:ATP-binding protein n=1 Tax=Mesorhizobium sp. TaxID=1871066 RepID=UPI00257DE984|nr:ATP-binding protein [Mesorhizobium sp.]
MSAVDHEMVVAQLDRLKLTAIQDLLDTLLDEAARSQMTSREALAFLVTHEIARRDERHISLAGKIAQFPFVRELDGFDFDAQPSLDQRAKSGSWRPGAGLPWRHGPVPWTCRSHDIIHTSLCY